MCKATLFRIAVLLFPMTQISCVGSENPLSDPETCAFDERLVGQWKWKSFRKNGTDTDVFIGRPRDIKNRLDGMMVIGDLGRISVKDQPWYFFATKIGDDEYLQMMPNLFGESDWKKVNVKGYLIAKYKITDNRLTMWLIDHEAAKNAVNGGKLKGTVEAGFQETIKLKESSEGLRRYLQKGGNTSLFPDRVKQTFERVERTK